MFLVSIADDTKNLARSLTYHFRKYPEQYGVVNLYAPGTLHIERPSTVGEVAVQLCKSGKQFSVDPD